MAQRGPSDSAAALLGQRLRNVRLQQGMSLQDVDDTSGGRFKASVVGAYERGERAMSLDRLIALAGFYRVPVGELVPSHEPPVTRPSANLGLVIDLTALDDSTPEGTAVSRFAVAIQTERRDYNGRVLSIRGDDVVVLAAALDSAPDDLRSRLVDAGMARTPNA